MPKFLNISLYTASALIAAGVLSACASQDNTGVRNGPQAVHPSPSALAQGTEAVAATQGDLAQGLFNEFCLGKPNAKASAQALRASGRFGKPMVFNTSFSTYTTYPYLARKRASVTVVEGSAVGIQCSVGVDNKGPNLYEDGTVKYSG